jgi:hypothetical protein
MEESGQLHAPASLPPGKQPAVPSAGSQSGWTSLTSASARHICSALLLPTLYLETVAAVIPGCTVVFAMLPRWNGVSKLKPLARKGGISK